MLPRHTLLALLAALQVYAVPLNINLGAYSPALVVGDGEISFGGAQNAGALMETLASGAAATAANAGQAAAPAAAAGAAPANAQSIRKGLDGRTPNMVKRDVLGELETQLLDEARKLKIKREINGFREALAYAREAQKTSPKIELGSEGAGVGIVVSPGVNVPANSPAAGAGGEGAAAAAGKVKRDAPEAESEPKQGITLLAIAEI